MAAVAGIGLVGACTLPSAGTVADLGWGVYYDSFAHAAQNKAAAFVLGGGEFLHRVGLGAELARTLMAVLVISFAATTLDTATRIERFIVTELGAALRLRILTNRYVATVVAIVPGILLALWKVPDPTTGAFTSAGWVLWPIFGASNQMLAGLTLMVLVLYFWQRKRPVLPLVLPMLFVVAITLASLFVKLGEFLRASNWLLLGLTALQLSLVMWMLVEGVASFVKHRRA
jgi:carbon starvation protein